MTCHLPLGPHTLLIVDGRGILGIWCSGLCLRDMHAMTFLRQVEESLLEGIDERVRHESSDDEGVEEDG